MTDKPSASDTGNPPAESEHHDNVEVVADNVTLQGDALDRFVNVFEAAARRWELVVYPALLAFVILAAYGFFLIYTLSKDMHLLASGMDPNMARNLSNMSDSVTYLSENVRTMTRRIDKISGTMEDMALTLEDVSGKMDTLETLDPMLVYMRGMDSSMRTLTAETAGMRYEVTGMGRNIARPMSIMNKFMPW
jgi:uncharacterized protein YoxC